MREITDIKPLENFLLRCVFNDGITKTVDLKPVLAKEAFLPLNDQRAFTRVLTKKYFIEWPELNIDLSADTLWHWGVIS